jgi:putative ABC transport system permease protein
VERVAHSDSRSGTPSRGVSLALIPIKYNVRSLIVRRVGTAMTVFGVALTVAVFVSILAMVQGIEGVFVDTGEPANLLILRQGSQAETNSFFNRDIKGIVETTDGVQTVAGEAIVLINHERSSGGNTNLIVRGISDKSMELRPSVKLADGRMFQPGLREVVVSKTLSGKFKNTRLGDKIKIGRTTWDVVGLVDTARTAYGSEIWADYDELAEEFNRPIYSSLLVRVADISVIQSVKDRLANDRRVKLDVFTQKEYFASQTSAALPIKVLAYVIAIIMSIGSCFAVMNTMYAATAYRTREIATLRVLGYKRRSIMVSFLIESLVLAVLGGLVGCLLALPVNGLTTGTANFATFSEVVFQFRITPKLILQAIVFAAVMGTIGGILPARVAARTQIIRALRTEV